jgi:hypothetical protein
MVPIQLVAEAEQLRYWLSTSTLSGPAFNALKREIETLPTKKQINDAWNTLATRDAEVVIPGGWSPRTLMEHLDRIKSDWKALNDLAQRFGPEAIQIAAPSVTKRPVAVQATGRRAATQALVKRVTEAAESTPADMPTPLDASPVPRPSWLPLAAIAAAVAAIIYWRSRR